MPKHPKVLILVESAGVDPWFEIEEKAQRPALHELLGGDCDLVWVSGMSDGDGDSTGLDGVRHIRRQLKLSGSPHGFLRKSIRWGIYRFALPAFGEDRARRFFNSRFQNLPTRIEGDRVWIPYPIQIHIAGLRTVETLRFALKNFDFEYLVRITSTCLVQSKPLFSFIETLPKSRVFGGIPIPFATGTFFSGASLIFSRDVAEGVVKNSHKLLLSVYEDVALSLLIDKCKLAEKFQFPRIEFSSDEDLPNLQRDRENAPVIRCKAQPSTSASEPVIRNMQTVRTLLGH